MGMGRPIFEGTKGRPFALVLGFERIPKSVKQFSDEDAR
ncbi:hypothetical protein CEV34_2631 [Brucella pseudogrignonensis]|uniref:Uncharacterized protein n=1 Tax=Brucella pseudogrignonensis TaxID=419475 RepID=A0A256GFH1_9HYPH|nr:hypothetical protein CEV34_2631 [Brucella pseudogrignonensis]